MEAASSITIELSGSSTPTSDTATPSVSFQTDGASCSRLVVSMPAIVNADTSSMTTAILLDQLDHQVSAVVEKVKISDLRFTKDGVAGLKVFLAMHAATVRHLQLDNILDCEPSGSALESVYALDSLVHSFQSAKQLVSLETSRNSLGNITWGSLRGHATLKKLTLDSVELSDDSLVELAATTAFTETLEDLHVELLHPLGPRGVEAANTLISACTSLKALHWIYKSCTQVTTLPLFGLCQMVQRTAQEGRLSLEILVLEGSRMKEGDVKWLCATLQELSQVKTLKLRNLGLVDNALRAIIKILAGTRPPISCLELSHNSIQSGGGMSLIELATCPEIASSLQRLCVDNNKIDGMVISKLLKAFSSRSCPELVDLRTENNASDSGHAPKDFAQKTNQADRDREEMVREMEHLKSELNDTQYHLREITTAQATILADYQKLKEENAKLREERNNLIRTFDLLGSANQVEAQSKLLYRISKLEDKVFGGPVAPPPNQCYSTSSSSSHTREGRRPPQRSISNDSIDVATLARVLSPKRAPVKGSGFFDASHNSVATLTTVSTNRSSISPNESANSFDDRRRPPPSPSPDYSSPTRLSRSSNFSHAPLTPSSRQQKMMQRGNKSMSDWWPGATGRIDMIKEVVTTPERVPPSPLSGSPRRTGRRSQLRDPNQSCTSFDMGGDEAFEPHESTQWSFAAVDSNARG